MLLNKNAINTSALNAYSFDKVFAFLTASATVLAEPAVSASIAGSATIVASPPQNPLIASASVLATPPSSAQLVATSELQQIFSRRGAAEITGSATFQSEINEAVLSATVVLVADYPIRKTLDAYAEFEATPFWPARGSAGLSGQAFSEATGTTYVVAEANPLAASASLTAAIYSEGKLQAEATVDVVGRIYVSLRSTLAARADTAAVGYSAQPYSLDGEDGKGLIIEPGVAVDQQRLRLRIDGSDVELYSDKLTGSCIEPGSLSVSYDGKEFTLAEYNIADPGSQTYANGQSVELLFDFGEESHEKLFSGTIRNVRKHTNNAESWVEYVVRGIQQLASEIDVLQMNSLGQWYDEYTLRGLENDLEKISQVSFQMGGTIIYYQSVKKKVRAAVVEFFDVLGSRFTEFGLSADYDLTGINADASMKDSLTLKGNLFAALRSITEMDEGCVPWWDDSGGMWRFTKPSEADVLTVDINQSFIDEMSWQEPLEDRYTAVRLIADQTLTRKTTSSTDKLYPFWNPFLETSWNVVKGSVPYSEKNGEPEFNEYWGVRRLWQVDKTFFPSDSDFKLQYKIDQAGSESWVAVDCEVILPGDVKDASDVENLYNYHFFQNSQRDFAIVAASEPIFTKGNPYVPGDTVGVEAEKIRLVWKRQSVSQLNLSVRYPETGFSGTAYDHYGLRKEKIVRTPWGSVTEENARKMHARYKDVKFGGTVRVDGYPLQYLHNLQKRMVFSHPERSTGMEDHQPMVQEYAYTFARPIGHSTITLSSDVSHLVRSTT